MSVKSIFLGVLPVRDECACPCAMSAPDVRDPHARCAPPVRDPRAPAARRTRTKNECRPPDTVNSMDINIAATISKFCQSRSTLRLVNKRFYSVNAANIITRTVEQKSIWGLERHHREVVAIRGKTGRPLLANILMLSGLADPMPTITMLMIYYLVEHRDNYIFNAIINWQRSYHGAGYAIDYKALRNASIVLPRDIDTLKRVAKCARSMYTVTSEPGFAAVEQQVYVRMSALTPAISMPSEYIYQYMMHAAVHNTNCSLTWLFKYDPVKAEEGLIRVAINCNTTALYARADLPANANVVINEEVFKGVLAEITPTTTTSVICNVVGRLCTRQAVRVVGARYISISNKLGHVDAIIQDAAATFEFITNQMPERRAMFVRKMWRSAYIIMHATAVLNCSSFGRVLSTLNINNSMMAATIVMICTKVGIRSRSSIVKRMLTSGAAKFTSKMFDHLCSLSEPRLKCILMTHRDVVIDERCDIDILLDERVNIMLESTIHQVRSTPSVHSAPAPMPAPAPSMPMPAPMPASSMPMPAPVPAPSKPVSVIEVSYDAADMRDGINNTLASGSPDEPIVIPDVAPDIVTPPGKRAREVELDMRRGKSQKNI